ncbi:phosphatase 2C-domain-containing protein [Pavlovales sp. CCMP2436]|nr:phosphatase 2C-domain-containing protein [Pavlovales sp. CCMP2436]
MSSGTAARHIPSVFRRDSWRTPGLRRVIRYFCVQRPRPKSGQLPAREGAGSFLREEALRVAKKLSPARRMLSAPVALCAGRLCKSWSVSTIQGRRAEQEDRIGTVSPGFVLLKVLGTSLSQTLHTRLLYSQVHRGDAARARAGLARAESRQLEAGTDVAPSRRERGGAGERREGMGREGVVTYRLASITHAHLHAHARTHARITQALSDAFRETETGFLRMAHAQKLASGTTALAVILSVPGARNAANGGKGELTVAHVGDSRGVLCRGGRAIELTQDHKPEDRAERARIEAAGGFVTERGYCMRAQGVLAMSRALGNRLLKPMVSAVPDVSTFPLTADDEFFVRATIFP